MMRDDFIAIAEVKEDFLATDERVACLVKSDEVDSGRDVGQLHERLPFLGNHEAFLDHRKRAAERQQLALEAVSRKSTDKHHLLGDKGRAQQDIQSRATKSRERERKRERG